MANSVIEESLDTVSPSSESFDWAKAIADKEQEAGSFDYATALTARESGEAVDFNPSIGRTSGKETMGFWAQVIVGSGDTPSERKNNFLRLYKDGDYITDNKGNDFFKRNSTDPEWSPIGGEPAKMKKLGTVPGIAVPTGVSRGDVGRFISDDIVATGAEIGVSMTPWGRAGGILWQAAKQGAATVLGDTAQQLGEAALGMNEETAGEIATRSATKGLFSAGGTTVIGGPGQIWRNIQQGSGALPMTPEARAVVRLAHEEGIPTPTPGMVSKWPLIQLVEKQSAATMGGLQEYYRQMRRAVGKKFKNLRDKKALNTLRENLARYDSDRRSAILNRMTDPRLTNAKAQGKLREAIQTWEVRSQEELSAVYKVAQDHGEADYVLDPWYQAVKQLQSEGRAAGKMKPPPPADINADPADMVPMERGAPVQSQPLKGEIADLVQRFNKIDPDIPEMMLADGTMATPTEFLRRARTRLFEIKQAGTAEGANAAQRAQGRQARTLYRALNEILTDPHSVDPNIEAAWRLANDKAINRFNTIEEIQWVREAGKPNRLDDLVPDITQPNRESLLTALQRSLKPNEYRTITDNFKTNLLDAPDKLTETLAKYDSPTLNKLLTKSERDAFQWVGEQIDKLNQVGVKPALRQQARQMDTARQLLIRNDKAGLETLWEHSRADKGLKTAVRAAVKEYSVRHMLSVDRQGIDTLSAGAKQTLQHLQDIGVLKFLTLNDIKIIKMGDKLAPFMRMTGDAGTSIQAAEFAGQVREIITPGERSSMKASALALKLAEFKWLDAAFSNPNTLRILVGEGHDISDATMAKLWGSIIGNMTASKSIEETTDLIEVNQ